MKIRLLFLAVILAASATFAGAQTVYKLFDAVSIDSTQYPVSLVFASKQLYLSCPSGKPQASLSGPDGGSLVVDDYITLNGANVCPTGRCVESAVSPSLFMGQAVDTSYVGIAPIDISKNIKNSNLYTFQLNDYGYMMGSSDVYLNTSCMVFDSDTQMCHGAKKGVGGSTIISSLYDIGRHLSHGDTVGPCTE